MEILSIAVRNDVLIKGIKIGVKETKLAQYADDTTALLNDADSAVRLMESVHKAKEKNIVGDHPFCLKDMGRAGGF